MHRFFISKEEIIEDRAIIKGQDARHIRGVIRLKEGEMIQLVTESQVMLCILDEVSREKVSARIVEKMGKLNEPPIKLTLFQGLPKASKMETILQKCTEVGVSSFYPVATERSVVKIKEVSKESKKLDRWSTIIEEASKQSMRDSIPQLGRILSFSEMLSFVKDKKVLVPYELERTNTLRDFIEDAKGSEEICIIIGPEGGFEEEEIMELRKAGAHTVTLGRRILRTETAGLVVASILLYELGDLGVIQ